MHPSCAAGEDPVLFLQETDMLVGLARYQMMYMHKQYREIRCVLRAKPTSVLLRRENLRPGNSVTSILVIFQARVLMEQFCGAVAGHRITASPPHPPNWVYSRRLIGNSE